MMLKDYLEKKHEIKKRLAEFKEHKSSDELFYELCFCLLTPQSKAKKAATCIDHLKANNFLYDAHDPLPILRSNIRFHNTKAKRLLLAKASWVDTHDVLISSMSSLEKRSWLVKYINGLGLKEASHFLRNIGHENLAILDRHILKHLVLHDVIGNIPKTLTPKVYFGIEKKFLDFADSIGIAMDEIDLLFWFYEGGEIFK